jgi:hypothetical protein
MPIAKPALRIYVVRHCLGCDEAERIAREVEARFAGLRVEVVDLDAPGVTAPAEVFATPTYVLDDKVVALGNPDLEELSRRLTRYFRRADSPVRGAPGVGGIEQGG